MIPTRPKRSWRLTILLGILALWVPTVARPDDRALTFGALPMSRERYQSYLKVTPSAELRSLEAALPAAYNAAALGFVTPAKDQGSCGACYAFAAVGAMESKLLMRGIRPDGLPPDLSEQQQVSCNRETYGCGGGFLDSAVLFWALPPNRNAGPLPEAVFPYAEADVPCRNPSEWQMNYRTVDFYTVPLSADEFKASLYNDGPGIVGFLITSDFLTFWMSAPPNSVFTYQSGSIVAGHAAVLIGWDDAKQAFLLKNSQGQHAGPNGDGTFWMSYANLGIGLNEMVNFRIMAVDPPRPVPAMSRRALVLAAGLLSLITLRALRRRARSECRVR